MRILTIPILSDNYAYLILKNGQGLLVDPAEGKPILNFLSKFKDIFISHLLITHNHWDHCGDAEALLPELEAFNKGKYNKKIDVIMGAEDAMNYTTVKVSSASQSFTLGDGDVKMQVYKVPCHTRGHVLFHLEDSKPEKEANCYEKALFTGDTLFSSGCGRFFAGNAQEMLDNFNLISKLSNDVQIFCGHEYTVANLDWSLKVDKDNADILNKHKWAIDTIKKGGITMPSSVEDEKKTNLFMRCNEEYLMKKIGVANPKDCMQKLRNLKNSGAGL